MGTTTPLAVGQTVLVSPELKSVVEGHRAGSTGRLVAFGPKAGPTDPHTGHPAAVVEFADGETGLFWADELAVTA